MNPGNQIAQTEQPFAEKVIIPLDRPLVSGPTLVEGIVFEQDAATGAIGAPTGEYAMYPLATAEEALGNGGRRSSPNWLKRTGRALAVAGTLALAACSGGSDVDSAQESTTSATTEAAKTTSSSSASSSSTSTTSVNVGDRTFTISDVTNAPTVTNESLGAETDYYDCGGLKSGEKRIEFNFKYDFFGQHRKLATGVIEDIANAPDGMGQEAFDFLIDNGVANTETRANGKTTGNVRADKYFSKLQSVPLSEDLTMVNSMCLPEEGKVVRYPENKPFIKVQKGSTVEAILLTPENYAKWEKMARRQSNGELFFEVRKVQMEVIDPITKVKSKAIYYGVIGSVQGCGNNSRKVPGELQPPKIPTPPSSSTTQPGTPPSSSIPPTATTSPEEPEPPTGKVDNTSGNPGSNSGAVNDQGAGDSIGAGNRPPGQNVNPNGPGTITGETTAPTQPRRQETTTTTATPVTNGSPSTTTGATQPSAPTETFPTSTTTTAEGGTPPNATTPATRPS